VNIGLRATPAATDDAVPVAVCGAQPQPAVGWSAALYPTPQTLGHRCRCRPAVLACRAETPSVDAPRTVGRIRVPVFACQHHVRPSACTSHGGAP
jgi:hypothetical protein